MIRPVKRELQATVPPSIASPRAGTLARPTERTGGHA